MASTETAKDQSWTTPPRLSPNHPAVRAAARRAGVDAATYVRTYTPRPRPVLLPAG